MSADPTLTPARERLLRVLAEEKGSMPTWEFAQAARLPRSVDRIGIVNAIVAAGWATRSGQHGDYLTITEAGRAALNLKAAAVDPRDPDHSRSGIFVNHNCWKCQHGALPCKSGSPSNCDFPHARND